MEADWSVELAACDPAILVPWSAEDLPEAPLQGRRGRQFVDLRGSPQDIDEIEEARHHPALRAALLMLNGDNSRLWTAKCDFWTRSGGGEDDCIDSMEMDAAPEDAQFAAGYYIDLLPRDAEVSGSFALQERSIRSLAGKLRGCAMRCARTDFVLRHAEVWGVAGFAVTWFAEGCGATPALARLRSAEALSRGLAIVMSERWDEG